MGANWKQCPFEVDVELYRCTTTSNDALKKLSHNVMQSAHRSLTKVSFWLWLLIVCWEGGSVEGCKGTSNDLADTLMDAQML